MSFNVIFKNKEVSLALLLSLLFVQTASIMILAVYVAYLNTQNSQNADLVLRSLIVNAAAKTYQAPTEDAVGQKLYLSDLRITLPVSKVSKNILYQDGSGSSSGPFSFSYHYVVHDMSSDRYPGINQHKPSQFSDGLACNRMVDVSFQKPGDRTEDSETDTKLLRDGRTIYITKNSPPNCEEYYNPSLNSDDLIDVLKSAESY